MRCPLPREGDHADCEKQKNEMSRVQTMNDENLGSAGASPALFGAPPKSFRSCPARRVTQRAGRPRYPLSHSLDRDSSTSPGMTRI
jgi:anti-sigma factor RsiW